MFLECGLRWDENNMNVDFPELRNKKILIYGAGKVGKKIYLKVASQNTVVGWVDKNYDRIPPMFCEKIRSPKEIINLKFEYAVVAVSNSEIRKEILMQIEKYNISKEKIIFVG